MQVSEIMTTNPACCTPDASLQEVARLMVENDCGCIPVVQSVTNKKPVGTITDRDIAIRGFASGKNPVDLKASDVMTADVVTITLNSSVQECCNVMENHKIRRVLVVDQNGNCTGIVAQADVAQYATNPTLTAGMVREISESAPTDVSASAGSWTGSRNFSGIDSVIKGESFLTFLAGLGSGAALMYFLDPERGRRRRALVSDQVTSLANDAQDMIGKTQRDLTNRAQGLWHETKKAVIGDAKSSDNDEQTTETSPESNLTTTSQATDAGNATEIGRSATQR
jgi:CBS domain-containing protein